MELSNIIFSTECSENKIVTHFKNEILDLDFSSSVFNKHTICKNFTQHEQNHHIIICKWSVS